MVRALTVGFGCLLPALLIAIPATARQSQRTNWEGVYSEVQAGRGQAAYEETCARCHAEDLLGNNAPALVGETFMNRFGGASADEMLKSIRRTMPQEAPDSLGTQRYLDIVSYLLKSNGSPAGAAELPTESADLQQILITNRSPNE